MKLYALCDQELLESRNISVEEFIDIAHRAGAEIIQYRNKNATIPFIKEQLIKIRTRFSGFLIVNDAYELAEFCDGVHVGQEDLRAVDKDLLKAVDTIRQTIGKDKLIGISTHNEREILEANEMDINYIGLGAYRETTTKEVNSTLGSSVDSMASISKHPVGVIGGVKLDDKFNNITYLVIGSGLL